VNFVQKQVLPAPLLLMRVLPWCGARELDAFLQFKSDEEEEA